MTNDAPTPGPDLAAPTTWTVRKADLIRYAGAARDFNAIHYDAGAAREFGFVRPVAHGMLTLGRVLTRVADHVGVDRLRSSSTRFSGPAHVGAELTLTFEQETDGVLSARVVDDDARTVLTTTVHLGGPQGDEPDDPRGELVADRWLVVEQGPATRFAETLGAGSAAFLRRDAALRAGHASVPVLPTYGFVLPGLGFFPDLPGNEHATVPDAVRDCQAWARTSGPVVHAGQRFDHSRPLLVGETVRSRSFVVGRVSKRSGERTLCFTDVHTVLRDRTGAHVLTSAMTLVVAD